LERYGKWIMISPHDIDQGAARFDKYGAGLVFVGRLLPAIRSYISIVAGISEMELHQFFIFSLLGSLVWCSVLAILGHQLGNNWSSISSAMRPYEVPITAGLALAVIAYIAYRYFRGAQERRAGHSAVDDA
jgi:membrane protein DedA with SNARE-associated domain